MLKRILFLFIFIPCLVRGEASDDLAYKTIEGYVLADETSIFYNYAFDVSFASLNTGVSLYGLRRFSSHQNEINVLYALQALTGVLMLYRTVSIIDEKGLFYEPYLELKNMKNTKLRERVAEYRLMEISNSVRQLRKISGTFGLISAGLIAAFSEGKTPELITSFLLGANSIFYLWFYESYGEDAYEKYFFYKKAYPQVKLMKDGLKVVMNFTF